MMRVLFVDDDPLILAGIRRLMRRIADKLHPEFANSGPEALVRLSEEPFDAIVSDMRMPGMDGAELLTRVRQQFPEMIRLILSGQSPNESKFRALGPAHQFLSKPCQPDSLVEVLTRAIRVRDRIADPDLRALVGQVRSLPSIPSVYAELVEELHSHSGSVNRVGEIVARDVAMTTKILHLINSSFFGLRQHIGTPSQAVCLLGIELVKSLVLTVAVFSQFRRQLSDVLWLEQLTQHSISTGKLSQKIARQLGATANEVDEALLAGMMHDVGKLILASERAEEYSHVVQLVANDAALLASREQACFGLTHADIGAYLLSLWGVPNSIVEAVAFHHRPADLGGPTPVVLTAVHLANALVNEDETERRIRASQLVDLDYLVAAGLQPDPQTWANLLVPTASSE